MPEALIAVTVLSVGLLVAAIAAAIEFEHGDARLALIVLISPGVLANLRDIGPETFATALVIIGLLAWTRGKGPRWGAVACFAAAALCRETMLLAPAALALHAQFAHGGGLRRWRPDAWRMATAALPLALWVLFLRAHLGVWPQPSNETLISPVHISGFLAATKQWMGPEVVGALVLIVPTAWLLVAARRTVYAPIAYTFAGFSVFVGSTMWGDDMKFGRLLLPLTALAIICGARRLRVIDVAEDDEDGSAAAFDRESDRQLTAVGGGVTSL